MEEVEVHDAYMWMCPKCNKRNFVVAIGLELGDEEKRELFEIPAWEPLPEEMPFYAPPPELVCSKCKHKCAPKECYDDDEDDE